MSPVLRARWLRVGALALAATALAAGAPYALRETGSFRIDHVEVRGTHYMTPQAVLQASGITRNATVFDDDAEWRTRLLAHPMIDDVEIERRVPGTIVLHVKEAEPIAYARTPELVAIDAQAHALPLDPAMAPLDLPVLGTVSRPASNGRFADRATLDLAQAIAAVRAFEPALAGWVSEAAPAPGSGLRLTLRGPTNAIALLPLPLTAERLRELRLTLADLAARGELRGTTRIEARYSDQIVVTPGRNTDTGQG